MKGDVVRGGSEGYQYSGELCKKLSGNKKSK